jgi:Uncharacterised protein family (UPF0158)
MPLPVKLSDVMEALEGASENLTHYLDKRSGDIILINEEEMTAIDDDEPLSDYPEWLQEQILKSREISESEEHFLQLPDQFEIHEYQIMQDFCRNVPDQALGRQLLGVIKGSGAFGRFKNAMRSKDMENDWYEFKRARLEEVAIDWLEENEIPYIHDDATDASAANM